MKTENTPKQLTFVEYAKKLEICPTRPWFNQHVDHYLVTSERIEHYASLKLQEANKEAELFEMAAIRWESKFDEANKKEILGDRKIVELEHDKTVLKSELKAKDEMLEKMAEGLRWYKGNFDGKDGTKWNGDLFFIEDKFGNTYSDQGENANELLTQYKQGNDTIR